MRIQPDADLASLLLGLGRTVVLQLDAQLQLLGTHNPALLEEWREAAAHRDTPGDLRTLLEDLMAPLRARDLLAHIEISAPDIGPAGLYLGVAPLREPRGGTLQRHVAISLHPQADGPGRLLVLRDVSSLAGLQATLAETQLALDSAMAALRTPVRALRLFLASVHASISAIRLTLRLPARDEAALRDKLARLHATVAQLDGEAQALNLTTIQDACQALMTRLDSLMEREGISGDALLPLAAMVDRIAAAADTLWRVEAQRHIDQENTSAPARPTARRKPDWTFASERRWTSFLRHRGDELGVIVNLRMQGAAHVPTSLRVSIDELLQHILRIAVEHGIETPEERLNAGKPASATIEVRYEPLTAGQLRMTVRDDGRGRGPGLTFLRRAVTRLGGQLAAATRPGEYTEFVIDLPHEAKVETATRSASS
jgi:signal transduction histidine kinase